MWVVGGGGEALAALMALASAVLACCFEVLAFERSADRGDRAVELGGDLGCGHVLGERSVEVKARDCRQRLSAFDVVVVQDPEDGRFAGAHASANRVA